MSSDIVDIGLRVDSTSVKDGTKALDQFAGQSDKTAKATAQAEKEAQKYIAALQKQHDTVGFNVRQMSAYELQHTKLTDAERASAQATLDGISKKEAYGRALFAVGAAAAAAAAAVALFATKLLSDAIPAAKEAEISQNRLEGVLKATGYAAGLSADSIENFVQSLTGATQFDDESIRNAAASLATFKNVQGDTFKEGLKLATDYAALFGGDVASAVYIVGRALDSPAEGLAALSRVGIRFSEGQKEQIKNFEETGRLAEAQAIITEKLRGKFGDVAETLNVGLNGATADLKKSWDELAESVGNVLTPAFISFASATKGVFDWLKKVADLGAPEIVKGSWVEEQTKRINNMAEEIATAQSDLANKRDNPLAFWLPPEEELRAKIAAIGAVISAESRHLNEQISAVGLPKDIVAEGKKAADEERAAQLAKVVRDKQELRTTELSREAAIELSKSYVSLFESALTPQDKFFNKLKEIAKVESVYGKSDVTRKALDVASNELHAGSLGLPETKAGQATDAAAKLADDTRARELQSLKTAMMTQEQIIEESQNRRLFLVADAFQNSQISLDESNALSTEAWARGEAQKSLILMGEITAREALQKASRDNDLNLTANFFGGLSALLGTQGKKSFEVSKALSIAEAIVKTYSATIKAYESQLTGDPTSPFRAVIAGAAAAAFGLAQIAKISSTHYGSTSASTSTGGGVPSGGSSGGGSASTPTTASAQTQQTQKTPVIFNISFNGAVLGTDVQEIVVQAMADFVGKDGVFMLGNSAQAQTIARAAA